MKSLYLILTIFSVTFFSLTSIGQNCTNCSGGTVSGTNASGLGTNPTSTGNSSLAGGYTSTASGDYSIAFGYQSKATGSNANAFGAMVESNHTNSTVIGRHLKTMASETFIFGTGYGPTQYLINSTPSSLMVGFNSQYPTFFVSSSGGAALTGKVAIGNKTSPSSKLHLYADVDEAAEIKLEPRTTGIRQYAQILFDTHSIRAGNTENMVFTTPAGRNFEFFIGNVGIGGGDPVAKLQVTDGDIFIEDIDRGIIMKSPDGNCWRGTLNNQGQLEFTQLPDCLTTAVSDNKPEDKPLFRISPNPASGIIQISCTTEELKEFSEYSLFDSAGNQLKTGKFDKTTFNINIQGLAAGTYILNFSGTRKFWSEKVIVR